MSAADPDGFVDEEPLTSKEGWARFVGYQLEPPALPGAAELLALTRRQRVPHDDAYEEYVRPAPAPSDYLATATTPAQWHDAKRPRVHEPRPLDRPPPLTFAIYIRTTTMPTVQARMASTRSASYGLPITSGRRTGAFPPAGDTAQSPVCRPSQSLRTMPPTSCSAVTR